MKNIYENIKKDFITKENKKLFLIVFALGMLIHFILYSQNIVAYDGYWHYGSFLSKGWELTLGRFMLPFADILRGTIVCSFLSTTISVAIISMTNIILCNLLKIKKTYLKVLMGILLLSVPTFSLTLMYTYTADSYTYALLFSVLSVYFLDNNKKIFGIISIIITLGFYQAYLGVILTLYLIVKMMHMLTENEDLKEFIKHIIIDIIIVVVSILIYYLILNIILKVLNLNLSEYGGGNSVSSLNTITNIFSSIIKTYDTFFKFYFTDSIVINTDIYAMKILYLVLFLIIFINLIYYVISKKIYKEKIKLLILLLAIVVYPIVTCSIELIATERTINLLMAFPLYLVFIILIKQIDLMNKKSIIKVLSIIFVSAFIWIFILVDNATYVASSMFNNQMTALGNRIITSVQEYPLYEENMDILIVGKANFNIQNDTLLKITYFDVTDINLWTWQIFLEDHLGSNRKIDLSKSYSDIVMSDEAYGMSIYPKENSIKIIDNVIVVKIGMY